MQIEKCRMKNTQFKVCILQGSNFRAESPLPLMEGDRGRGDPNNLIWVIPA